MTAHQPAPNPHKRNASLIKTPTPSLRLTNPRPDRDHLEKNSKTGIVQKPVPRSALSMPRYTLCAESTVVATRGQELCEATGAPVSTVGQTERIVAGRMKKRTERKKAGKKAKGKKPLPRRAGGKERGPGRTEGERVGYESIRCRRPFCWRLEPSKCAAAAPRRRGCDGVDSIRGGTNGPTSAWKRSTNPRHRIGPRPRLIAVVGTTSEWGRKGRPRRWGRRVS